MFVWVRFSASIFLLLYLDSIFYVFSGKIECALFGEYVALWNGFVSKGFEGLPVVVVQFAKVKIFRGVFDVCI